MGLREIESTLPPGFRFYPSDEELVCHYLYKKVANERAAQGTLVEVDLHAREPWELPGEHCTPPRSSRSFSLSPMHDVPFSPAHGCCMFHESKLPWMPLGS
jgi:hypothetical protein